MTYDEYLSAQGELDQLFNQGEINITQYEDYMENLIEEWDLDGDI